MMGFNNVSGEHGVSVQAQAERNNLQDPGKQLLTGEAKEGLQKVDLNQSMDNRKGYRV